MNKNRGQEPIEVRLLREGKLREKRRKERIEKETNKNKKSTRVKKKDRKRTTSEMIQPNEIVLTNRGIFI